MPFFLLTLSFYSQHWVAVPKGYHHCTKAELHNNMCRPRTCQRCAVLFKVCLCLQQFSKCPILWLNMSFSTTGICKKQKPNKTHIQAALIATCFILFFVKTIKEKNKGWHIRKTFACSASKVIWGSFCSEAWQTSRCKCMITAFDLKQKDNEIVLSCSLQMPLQALISYSLP